ncbi:biosynthetic-type acetolactate synthase large subunit [Paludicola sp. MB14-C6]|uniref:biosynthetic-type acetolactate synthase large subunit n=1 Tax=Paludihabitans sp. MB14-C6 TaxID=3070656 RepID=UPI0027DB7219|nr:biosynthetic-type acetolactate synthase large subunit [Paludicola sp. MB14-C6]WMJ22109.1 biosynthetic-type acetolactate synthase large subunit [Paludicola sp. MB14-C6]
MITAASAMVKCLQKEGVQVVFGLPGATICPFYDALYHSNIKHILVRQEQGAGHAANGYARITNKPGVCIATSGPGALNLITAIATAYMDSIPIVVITGQVASDLLGRDVFQEADITGAAEPFVKHSFLVSDAKELPSIMKSAFLIASTGRQGPVLIDVPVDIQKEMIDFSYPETIEIRSYHPNIQGHSGQIKRVLNALAESKKPLICAGGGVFSANACKELTAFSQKSNIPVVSTMMGLSAVSPTHSLYYGMIGMNGSEIANHAMNQADVIILLGARVGDRAIMSPIGLSKTAKIIHIDIDPAEIGKNIVTNIPLVGDAKHILSEMIQSPPTADYSKWITELKSYTAKPLKSRKTSKYVNPHEFLSKLMEKADSNACIIADVGQNQIWTARNYCIEDGRFLTSGGMGTMGYSIPAAIGAKLASPNAQVVAICGDGAFQMQMMELATIKENQITVKIIVMNNHALGLVKEVQDQQYNKNEIAVQLDGNPDFVKLAKAYQINAKRITTLKNIDDVLSEFLENDTSFVLECIVSPDEPTL